MGRSVLVTRWLHRRPADTDQRPPPVVKTHVVDQEGWWAGVVEYSGLVTVGTFSLLIFCLYALLDMYPGLLLVLSFLTPEVYTGL